MTNEEQKEHEIHVIKSSIEYNLTQISKEKEKISTCNANIKHFKKNIIYLKDRLKKELGFDPLDMKIRWRKIAFQQNLYFDLRKWHHGKKSLKVIREEIEKKKTLYKNKVKEALHELDKVEKLTEDEAKKMANSALNYMSRKKRW